MRKSYWITGSGLLGLFMSLAAMGDSRAKPAEEPFVALTGGSPAEGVTHTKDSLDKVKSSVHAKKAILIDVREKGEWDAGHLTEAQLLPLSALKAGISVADLAKTLSKNKTIYLHCASGRRVLPAAEILRKAGYLVEPLKAGYTDLIEVGFEKAAK